MLQDTQHMKPPSRRRFVQHLTRQAFYAGIIVAASLLLGMAGYHWWAGFGWVDAFENASMLLGGMGPVDPVATAGGKIFAGMFALYAGLVFLAVTALVLMPVFHHALHRFHWDMSHPE
jgi:hypothetical protein